MSNNNPVDIIFTHYFMIKIIFKKISARLFFLKLYLKIPLPVMKNYAVS